MGPRNSGKLSMSFITESHSQFPYIVRLSLWEHQLPNNDMVIFFINYKFGFSIDLLTTSSYNLNQSIHVRYLSSTMYLCLPPRLFGEIHLSSS